MQMNDSLVDPCALRAGLARWCDALELATQELNALDAQLGDGDLGNTLAKCAENVRQLALPADASLDVQFKACAQACARASGSSFGTLLAVAFLTTSRSTTNVPVLGAGEIASLLDDVVSALSQRGGAVLGDKTMLDSLDAIARAMRTDIPDANAARLAVQRAAQEALDGFRSRPNRIGRARMFAERSVGLDDPGMVAVLRMAQAL